MTVTLTWQSFVVAAGVVGAIFALISQLKKIFGWFDKQEMQDTSIKDIQEEQALLTAGILACLKGLVELGCDGAVKEQINKIETHINKKAHEVKK